MFTAGSVSVSSSFVDSRYKSEAVLNSSFSALPRKKLLLPAPWSRGLAFPFVTRLSSEEIVKTEKEPEMTEMSDTPLSAQVTTRQATPASPINSPSSAVSSLPHSRALTTVFGAQEVIHTPTGSSSSTESGASPPSTAVSTPSTMAVPESQVDSRLLGMGGPRSSEEPSAKESKESTAESGNRSSVPKISIASLTNPSNSSDNSHYTQCENYYEAHSSNGTIPMEVLSNISGLGSLASETPNGRKKRQCSQCHGWFSNLATHKSIHVEFNSRPHTCEECGRGFARPNDLFRHQKSHRGEAAFRCPFFLKTSLSQSAFVFLEPACHQTGGFSRCDTYKNHLKAMHFEYPPGTKKRDRSGMHGKCRGCGETFDNADEWIVQHIETGACSGIQKIKKIKEENPEIVNEGR